MNRSFGTSFHTQTDQGTGAQRLSSRADELRPGPGSLSAPDPRVLAALTTGDAVADRALSLRTRRTVYKALVARRTNRQEDRRNISIAFLITGALTLALAPALWAGIDDMLSGETLLDLPEVVVALGITMFAAVLAVLWLVGVQREGDGSRAPRL